MRWTGYGAESQKSKNGRARSEQDSTRPIGGPFHPICRRCVDASAGWKLLDDRARCFGSIPKSGLIAMARAVVHRAFDAEALGCQPRLDRAQQKCRL
jgi:hypothetical protein